MDWCHKRKYDTKRKSENHFVLIEIKARGGGGGGGVRASKNRENYYSLNQFIFDDGNFAATHLFVAA